MTRDIEARLNIFESFPLVRRVALNMDQIEQYLPPPNPTKLTDTRATSYISEFGYECWELDALDPQVMEQIKETNVSEFLDIKRFNAAAAHAKEAKATLRKVADHWDDIKKRYA
ncbi:hypothetical protein AB4Z50_25795 [Paenibacillus sp. 2TAB26]|uniref:hypothetical protein n=1 Tax=Paenibacillus sp. 2TAB26 TaxID=3233005 RepID=UPI003F9C51C0